ncbi:glucose-6-phosphate dehydrogenase [Amnibacterium sp. CER49]|uniref:glucose-6-phosphate dehydrogenase n=1 Tax=Amnibacterium sp. CER49 TaxID=3039161 RepID=UPI00244D0B41|nr:glucose-6-phosphate dehydrogenase [Amnibacterium sp. CER49]MDH2442469.1 glucose-6-phosphate dehydrogenase [Amnibacterium sp. CER49]
MASESTLLILGASGDLTKRLLLPGLGSLITGGDEADLRLLDGLTILGSARSERARDDWQGEIREAFEGVGAKGDLARALIEGADYVAADPTEPDGLKRLLDAAKGDLVVYFALPPAVITKVADVLADVDLPERTVLAIEKPFGGDAESAAALNEQLRRIVPEDRIHRVDHFLNHRAALGMLATRFNNRILERAWNADDVERVEIVYDETLGLEGRASYYDTAGALRDMLQSHLLQVLAIAATEAPVSLDATNLRDALATALRATRVWPHGKVFPNTDQPSRRARYTAGTVGDKQLPDYVDEEGVDPDRGTETLAEIALEVNTARWAGVPFVLRSGKAIGNPRDEIALTFRPLRFVPGGQTGEGRRERVVLGFKPPRIEVAFTSGGGDMPFELEAATLEGTLPKSPVTEYGEVLRGVLGDDPTLSVRGDVAEQCWRIVQPILDAWQRGEVPLDEYPAGSAGPDSWQS